MSHHIYELGFTKTTGAAAGPIAEIVPATLAAGVQPPEILEIGVFNSSGVAAEIGLGYPAAQGASTFTSYGTVQPVTPWDNTGNTTVGSYATPPTAPTNYLRRAQLMTLVGGGVIWTWALGEFALWSGATISHPVLWQISALAVTYDCYVKVHE